MQLGRHFADKQILSVTDARIVGTAKDLYVDPDLYQVTGVFLGSEGLFSRKTRYIRHEDVYLYGRDVILVRTPEVIVTTSDKSSELKQWLRCEQLKGRQVSSPTDARVGKIGDVILDKTGQVVGFELAETFVSGSVAENQAFKRDVIIEVGDGSQPIVIDLIKAEQQKWFFSG